LRVPQAHDQRRRRAAGGQAHRPALQVDAVAAPAGQQARARIQRAALRRTGRGGRGRRAAQGAQVDVRIHEGDAAGLEAAAARHAPRIQGDDQFRGVQRRPGAGIAHGDIVEHRLRTVPAPAHAQATEADLQPGLMADQLLKGGPMLRHAGGDHRESQEHRERQHGTAAESEGEQLQVRACGPHGARRSRCCGRPATRICSH
jgi:hypothetical protein